MKHFQIILIVFYSFYTFGQISYSDTNNILLQLKKIEQINYSISNKLDSCCKRSPHGKKGTNTIVYVDSSKYKTIIDTIITSDNRVIQQTIVESKEQNECDECSFNICDCKILADLIWPTITLIIIILFYRRIKLLIDTIICRIEKGAKLSFKGFELGNVPEKEKAEKEYEDVKQDQTINNSEDDLDKTEYIPKYIQLERQFFSFLAKFFYIDFKILSNRTIDVFEYDIILESTTPKEIDYIFEIKFFPKHYSSNSIKNAIAKLDLATKHYIDKTQRFAKPILIVIVQNDSFSTEKFEAIVDFTNKNTTNLKNMSTAAYNFEEFDNLSKEDITKLMRI